MGGTRLFGSSREAFEVGQVFGMASEDNALEVSGKLRRSTCAGNRQEYAGQEASNARHYAATSGRFGRVRTNLTPSIFSLLFSL
jgi:hypothetical protein